MSRPVALTLCGHDRPRCRWARDLYLRGLTDAGLAVVAIWLTRSRGTMLAVAAELVVVRIDPARHEVTIAGSMVGRRVRPEPCDDRRTLPGPGRANARVCAPVRDL